MCLPESEPRRHLSINLILIMSYLVVVNYINSVHIYCSQVDRRKCCPIRLNSLYRYGVQLFARDLKSDFYVLYIYICVIFMTFTNVMAKWMNVIMFDIEVTATDAALFSSPLIQREEIHRMPFIVHVWYVCWCTFLCMCVRVCMKSYLHNYNNNIFYVIARR